MNDFYFILRFLFNNYFVFLCLKVFLIYYRLLLHRIGFFIGSFKVKLFFRGVMEVEGYQALLYASYTSLTYGSESYLIQRLGLVSSFKYTLTLLEIKQERASPNDCIVLSWRILCTSELQVFFGNI